MKRRTFGHREIKYPAPQYTYNLRKWKYANERLYIYLEEGKVLKYNQAEILWNELYNNILG